MSEHEVHAHFAMPNLAHAASLDIGRPVLTNKKYVTGAGRCAESGKSIFGVILVAFRPQWVRGQESHINSSTLM